MEFLDQSSRTSAVLCTVTSNVHAHSQTSDLLHSTLIQSTPPRTISSSNTLLKQCLSDTSFQTKYNLKPFDFGVTTGFVTKESPKTSPFKKEPGKQPTSVWKTYKELGIQPTSEVKSEPVLDKEQVKKDIPTTCEMLSISSDPHEWSTEDVRSWLFWTVQQFSIPMSLLNLDLWNMDGQAFIQLSEQDFKRRLPQGGDTMYAQFDIWRSSAGYESPQTLPLPAMMVPRHAPPPYQEPDQAHSMTGQDNANSSTDNYMDIAYMLQMRWRRKLLVEKDHRLGLEQTYICGNLSRSCYFSHNTTATQFTGFIDKREYSKLLTLSRWPLFGEKERTAPQ
jgi:hypothetical protein